MARRVRTLFEMPKEKTGDIAVFEQYRLFTLKFSHKVLKKGTVRFGTAFCIRILHLPCKGIRNAVPLEFDFKKP